MQEPVDLAAYLLTALQG